METGPTSAGLAELVATELEKRPSSDTAAAERAALDRQAKQLQTTLTRLVGTLGMVEDAALAEVRERMQQVSTELKQVKQRLADTRAITPRLAPAQVAKALHALPKRLAQPGPGTATANDMLRAIVAAPMAVTAEQWMDEKMNPRHAWCLTGDIRIGPALSVIVSESDGCGGRI